MDIPACWTWGRDAVAAARLWDEVQTFGLSRVRWPEAVDAAAHPSQFISRLLGLAPFRVRARRVEVLGEGAKNYENSNVTARLHTDYDPYLPAHLQVLICCRPAAAGGDSLFLDGWELAAAARRDEPALYADLFNVPRLIPFGPGPWFGPTLSMRLDNLVLVHGAVPPPDEVGARLFERVKRARPAGMRLEPGELVVMNHHRLLHGRTAFSDPERLLIRVLVWLHEPLAAQPRLARDARRAAGRLAQRLSGEPAWIRQRFGVFDGEGLGAAAFQHDFSRLPATPDSQSAQGYAEICAALRRLVGASLPQLAALPS